MFRHYYGADATTTAVVLGSDVIVVGEYGACFLAVEDCNFNEWKRLVTSEDAEEQRRAHMFEWLVCKRKHAHIV